jgi:hypothetical protein
MEHRLGRLRRFFKPRKEKVVASAGVKKPIARSRPKDTRVSINVSSHATRGLIILRKIGQTLTTSMRHRPRHQHPNIRAPKMSNTLRAPNRWGMTIAMILL